MLRPLTRTTLLAPGPGARFDAADRPRPFPTLDRAFDAVERTLARLGVEDPGSLRSPKLVEDELSPTALPAGTLLVMNADELASAEADVQETVQDERLGGTAFGSLDRPFLVPDERRRRLRELAGTAVTFAFLPIGTEPHGTSRLRQVRTPALLRGYRFLVADAPGFRVALVSRALPGGGFLALWSGDPTVVDEVTGVLRAVAQADGHALPPRAPAVPARDVVTSHAEVWKQAEELRAFRTVREAELRAIARSAALRGVELRREREREDSRQAG